MQNHHSLLYREEEREMLPLLKVSACHPRASKSGSGHNVQLESSAPWRRMHPMESVSEGFVNSTMGRDKRTREIGRVSVQASLKNPRA